MNYNTIEKIYLKIYKIINKFLLTNKDLEDDYYINGEKNILTNKVNIYIDYLNFLEINNYFKFELKNNINILDLGCGLGDKAVIIKKMFPSSNVYGVETTNNDDHYLKKYPPHKAFEKIYPLMTSNFNIDLSLYDGYNLNFPNSTFDIIFLYVVIEHISPSKRKNFINNISKKIKKSGYIIITRCPRYYSLTEFISRKFKLGAHEWVLKKQELLSLFDKNLFDIAVFKRISNVPANPRKITNKILFLLVILDKFLNFTKWPFSSDYFLIIKKKQSLLSAV